MFHAARTTEQQPTNIPKRNESHNSAPRPERTKSCRTSCIGSRLGSKSQPDILGHLRVSCSHSYRSGSGRNRPEARAGRRGLPHASSGVAALNAPSTFPASPASPVAASAAASGFGPASAFDVASCIAFPHAVHRTRQMRQRRITPTARRPTPQRFRNPLPSQPPPGSAHQTLYSPSPNSGVIVRSNPSVASITDLRNL